MEPSAEEDDAEIAPAASEQEQVIAEERETIKPAASELLAAAIQEKLRPLEWLHERVSELLVASGPRRVTGDTERRILAVMEMELSIIVESLKLGPPPMQDHHVDESMWCKWLTNLCGKYDAGSIVGSVAPSRHPLLRRIAQYRRHTVSRWYWQRLVKISQDAEHPCTYWHNLLPAATSDLVGRPPHVAAEAGAVPLLVGVDRPIRKLLRWLVPCKATNGGLRFMCIVGPVGVGKTALAMEIHNRLSCKTIYHDFQCNVMARAPRTTDGPKLLLQDILSKISDPAYHSRPLTMDLLVRHVSERLQDKRYFICIDDMREEASDWAEIMQAFPDNNLGSRVLITTRTERPTSSMLLPCHVPEWACSSDFDVLVHKMKPLNLADSERLIHTMSFGSMVLALPKQARLCLDLIATKCEGLPLFITAMIDFTLTRKWDEEESTFQLPKRWGQALCSVYDGLSYETMMLSLYMSMFPYGYKFDKDRLIRKWLCEGLVPSNGWHPMEYYEAKNDAEKHFSRLVGSTVFTRAANSKRNPDQAEAGLWHVNQFFQRLIVLKSAEIGFAFTSTTLKSAAARGHDNGRKILPRRLALHHTDPTLPNLLQTLDFSCTRLLTVSGAVSGVPLHKFFNLVALDLEGWKNLTDEVLLKVCTSKMFLLRYLSIRNTRVSKIPHEIKHLFSLCVLDVGYTQISELPLEVFKLASLYELDLRCTRIKQLPKQIVELKDHLSALLLGDEGMINSTVIATRVPHDIMWNFRYLQILAVDLSEQPVSFIIDLGRLRMLREVAITLSIHQCADKAYSDALTSSIEWWENLKSLTIHCGLGCSIELDFPCDPPRGLEKFKVTAGRFASVPKWIHRLYNLSFVQITVWKQEMEDLKILGVLPHLQCLILGLDFFPTKAVVIESQYFLALERFSVDCPMPWLSFSTGAMQKLTYLQLKFCAIPASETSVPSDICNLASLTEVVLCYNEQYANSPGIKRTVDAIRKQVAKHRNPIDLFINETEDYDVQSVDVVAENPVAAQNGTDAGTKDGVQAVQEKNAATKIQSASEIEEIHSDA